VVRARDTLGDDPVVDRLGHQEIGQSVAVQVAQLASAGTELDTPKAMWMATYPVPPLDSGPDTRRRAVLFLGHHARSSRAVAVSH
jgi:hypothetical protein